MSASVGDPTESPPAIDPERPARPRRNPRDVVEPRAPDVHEICPYLAAAGGAWRSSSPHREHRCGAVEPPAALSSEKQRRLCLSVDHASCQTFRAARASRAAMLAPGVDPAAVAAADAARRPVARSSAIILEHPRLSAPRARWPVDRAMSQVVLVGLMIVAVLALAIARLPGPGVAAVAGPSATVSPTASPTVRPTARPTLRPSPSAAASASSPASPSAAPSGIVSGVTATPTPAPSAGEIYVVKKGDTLYGIASQFGTTVAAIKSLNNLTSNDLKIGQKLQIPE